jgi:glycogen debranching enzyme
VRTWLQPLIGHLDEAGLGTVSEIFDGDAPHAPRGCVAQAWSVSETLRVLAELPKN